MIHGSAQNGKFYLTEHHSKILEHSEDNINIKRKKLLFSSYNQSQRNDGTDAFDEPEQCSS